jgi:hypothetical protein
LTGTLLGVVLLAFLQNGLTPQRLLLLAHRIQRRHYPGQHQCHGLERKTQNWQGSFEMKTIARFLPGDAIIRLQCVIIVVVALVFLSPARQPFLASLTSSR